MIKRYWADDPTLGEFLAPNGHEMNAVVSAADFDAAVALLRRANEYGRLYGSAVLKDIDAFLSTVPQKGNV